MNGIVRLTAWLCLGFIIFVTLSPLALRPEFSQNPDIDRLGAFTLLSVLFGLSYPRRFALVTLITVGTAALLEALQTLTIDRHGHLADLLVKITGALIGALIARAIVHVSARTG